MDEEGDLKQLRTVVVGLGRIGWQFHLPQVDSHAGYALVGVVDPLAERLEEARASFGVPGYADLATCLAQSAPDLVVIAAPTPLHTALTEMATASGCHVLCDKPMAPSLAEADRMIAAARIHDRRLVIYQPQRGSREVVALQAILRQGLIGEPYLIRHTRTRYARRNDWQAWRQHGGGMLNNYGAHLIDACLHLVGSPARDITCHLRTIASAGDADDVVKALIRTESDVLIDIDINMASAQPMLPRWHVLGSCGSLQFDDDDGAWQVRWYDPAAAPALAPQDGLAAADRQYGNGEQLPWQQATFGLDDVNAVDFYAEAHGHFTDGGRAPVPLAESRELMRVLDACRADADRR